jgi:small multidrug resistance pump
VIANATLHRRLFQAAAVYNLAFFAWSALAPGQFFALAGAHCAPPAEYLWQCVGMVVGVYGLLYWHASRHLDRARPIIAVGLLGKVLGPIGWVWTFAPGRIAAPTFVVVALNDILWWPGFASFLLRERSQRTRFRVCACALLAAHAGGALLLAFATGLGPPRAGTEVAPVPWTLAWALWCTADVLSLPFVCSLLARRAAAAVSPRTRWIAALVLVAAACDFALNVSYAALVPPATALTDPTWRFLSLTVANGLFVAAYAILSWVLARAGTVPRWNTLLGMPAWLAASGLCLTGCGLLPGWEPVLAAVFVVFFCAWLLGLVLVDDF